jgi:outer membrane protein assembly factor BamB
MPGGRPMVFVGSYDGTFYGLDARSGAVRWKYYDGGAISGGSSVVGDIVYFANIRHKTTTGLNVRTGKVVFRWPDGAYNPVISDTRTIFLVGNKALYALQTPETIQQLKRQQIAYKEKLRAYKERKRKAAAAAGG